MSVLTNTYISDVDIQESALSAKLALEVIRNVGLAEQTGTNHGFGQTRTDYGFAPVSKSKNRDSSSQSEPNPGLSLGAVSEFPAVA
jgi:hypothetical protein